MSKQPPIESGLPSHMEPVRSMTTMMSNCFVPHGWHAAPVTLKLKLLIPTIFAYVVGTLPDSLTVILLAGAPRREFARLPMQTYLAVSLASQLFPVMVLSGLTVMPPGLFFAR